MPSMLSWVIRIDDDDDDDQANHGHLFLQRPVNSAQLWPF